MSWLLYGASGYTGNLIAHRAVEKGLKPILAGRREAVVRPLAEKLGLSYRCFDLADQATTVAGLKDVKAVLNCAGPFSATFTPMIRGCLEAKVHYLDITGETDVLERAHSLAGEAKAAGIVLIPGVGFDVVPSDCLAAALARKLSSASQLELAIASTGGASPGTLKTAVENIGAGSLVRRAGRLEKIGFGSISKKIPFSQKPMTAVAVPWGDLVTAYYSTSIPNITVYWAMPKKVVRGLKLMRPLMPILRLSKVQTFLKSQIEKRVKGPTEDVLTNGRMSLWGRAYAADGASVEAWLETGEGYALTVATSLAILDQVMKDTIAPGFWTPSQAFGPDFIKSIPGTKFTWKT